VLRGWGMANHARSWVYRPGNDEEVAAAILDARDRGLTVGHRGAGQSYGDAALNEGGAILMSEGLDEIVEFDTERGLVRAGSGTSIEALWKTGLPHGWWPPVVPGTMKVTLGGAVAMNVHGKNQYAKGSIGEHVAAVSVVDSKGRLKRFDRTTAPGEVRGVIGAQGLTGFISDVSLAMSRVHSGYLEVESWSTGSMGESLALLENKAEDSDYSVGWVDCFPDAARAGRGILHFARQLPADHPRSGQAMNPGDQRLPPRVAGLLPREWAWRALRMLTHDPGMRLLNLGRAFSGRMRHGHRYYQTHAAFHFLLDYVPGWKRAYGSTGLIQYQLFVPSPDATAVFEEALRIQRRLGVVSYLAVLKRHRADDFPASYSVDGFSLALDFPVRLRSLAALRDLCRSFDALLRDVGGSIYAAKDAVGVGRLPDERDPVFATNLTRRWERSAPRDHA